MRKKGIITLLVILIILVGLSFYFSDAWVERQIEKTGSSIVGAKVELDGFDISIFSLHIKWQRLQVTDPKNTMQNIFETGETNFDLAFEPLLYKNYIIENITLEGLRLHTARSTDGALPKSAQSKEESVLLKTVRNQLQKQTAQMPVFQLNSIGKKMNVDSLWKLVNLQSPRKTDSLKKAYAAKINKWEKRVAQLPDEKELAGYQAQIEAIQPEKIKDIKSFQTSLKTAKSVYKDLDSLYKNLKSVKTDFQKDFKSAQSLDDQLKMWVADDYKNMLKMAHLPDVSVKNAAKILFGKQIINRLETVIGYINTVRQYSDKFSGDETAEPEPERFAGQDIHYSSRLNWPQFWIKQIRLSGEAENQVKLSGTIHNIVSRQALIGKPTEFQINGQSANLTSVEISGRFDYRNALKNESINLTLRELPLQNTQLTEFALLPKKLRAGKGEIQAKLNMTDNDYQADVHFEGQGIQFDLPETATGRKSRLNQLTREIAASIQTITFLAKAQQKGGHLSLKMNSNLDNLIAKKMKAIFSREVAQTKAQLQKRLNKEVSKYEKELRQYVAANEAKIRAKISRAETEVNKQKAKIDAKRRDLENKIAREQEKLKKKLQNKAKDKLKDLFNKK